MSSFDRGASPRAGDQNPGWTSHGRARHHRIGYRGYRRSYSFPRRERCRSGRGAGLKHGEGPGRRIGTQVFGSRYPRPQRRTRQLADLSRRAAIDMTPTDEHPEEAAAQEQLLRRIDYLRDLDRVDIARLIGSSEDLHFDRGAIIVREGEAADARYLP